jgi:hypothetical protein
MTSPAKHPSPTARIVARISALEGRLAALERPAAPPPAERPPLSYPGAEALRQAALAREQAAMSGPHPRQPSSRSQFEDEVAPMPQRSRIFYEVPELGSEPVPAHAGTAPGVAGR